MLGVVKGVQKVGLMRERWVFPPSERRRRAVIKSVDGFSIGGGVGGEKRAAATETVHRS